MPEKYKRLQTACSLTVTSLKEAALGLQASSVYTLHVGARSYYDAKHVAALAMEVRNPFSPYINLVLEEGLTDLEWYVTDEHGNAVGSEGC
jgi:hypothetical protein